MIPEGIRNLNLRQNRKYNISVLTYSVAGFIPVMENCIGFMFTNIGAVTAFVNGMVIFPPAVPNSLGDSRTIMAHRDDLFGDGQLKLSFLPGAGPLVEIVQIFYQE